MDILDIFVQISYISTSQCLGVWSLLYWMVVESCFVWIQNANPENIWVIFELF